MNKLTKSVIAAAFSTALVFAQGPGRGFGGGTPPDPQVMAARRAEMLAKRLGLSDTQKSAAQNIFVNADSAAQNLRTSLKSNAQSLSDAVKRNDSAAIDQFSSVLGTLTGQLTAIQKKADAAVYALLTPDQKTKFDSMPHGGPGPGFAPQGFRPRPDRNSYNQ